MNKKIKAVIIFSIIILAVGAMFFGFSKLSLIDTDDNIGVGINPNTQSIFCATNNDCLQAYLNAGANVEDFDNYNLICNNKICEVEEK